MVAGLPLSMTDDLLASEIAMQLAGTNRANLRRLAVDVHQGAVTLRGRVGSFYEKQIAIETCRMRADIARLVDDVEVES